MPVQYVWQSVHLVLVHTVETKDNICTLSVVMLA